MQDSPWFNYLLKLYLLPGDCWFVSLALPHLVTQAKIDRTLIKSSLLQNDGSDNTRLCQLTCLRRFDWLREQNIWENYSLINAVVLYGTLQQLKWLLIFKLQKGKIDDFNSINYPTSSSMTVQESYINERMFSQALGRGGNINIWLSVFMNFKYEMHNWAAVRETVKHGHLTPLRHKAIMSSLNQLLFHDITMFACIEGHLHILKWITTQYTCFSWQPEIWLVALFGGDSSCIAWLYTQNIPRQMPSDPALSNIYLDLERQPHGWSHKYKADFYSILQGKFDVNLDWCAVMFHQYIQLQSKIKVND